MEHPNEEAQSDHYNAIGDEIHTPSLVTEEELSDKSDTEILETAVGPAAAKPKFKLVLELAVFMYFFAHSLTSSVFQNQLLYQSCIVVFQYNKTTCEPLKGTTDKTAESENAEGDIQIYVSKIMVTSSILTSVIPAILSLFIGPWSDKFGRRLIILTIAIAYLFDYVIFTILGAISLSQEFSPWLYLLPCIPPVLCGGNCALTTIVYSYVSDTSEGRERAIRMLVVEAFFGVGAIVGSMSSGYLLAASNFTAVYGLATAIMLIATIYTYFLVIESLRPDQLQTGSKFRAFFDFALVADLFRTGFKHRPNRGRAVIWLTICSLVVTRFVSDGESNVVYFFLTKKLAWTLQNYNLYTTISSVVLIAGGVMGVIVLRKRFNCSLAFVNMISYAGATVQSLIRALAAYTWEIYVGLVVGFMSGVPNSMSLALLSHVTPSKEIGKIFALSSALLTLVPLGAAPLYTLIYDTTLNTDPGVYNYLSFGFFIIAFIMMATIMRIQKIYAPSSSNTEPSATSPP